VSEDAEGVGPRACPGAEDPVARPDKWAGEAGCADADAAGDPEARAGVSGA
jgi:hypothetical protein